MQAFELLQGHWAFHAEPGPAWTIDDDHLARILELTGEESFSVAMLARAERRGILFRCEW